MFSSGARIDLGRLEEEIRKEIEEKTRRLFTAEELEELQKLELNTTPNPDRVRTFFYRQLEFPDLQRQLALLEQLHSELPATKFYNADYNIDLNTFLASSNSLSGRIITNLRSLLRPFFRLYGNIDALIHKQAIFNREQAQFNAKTVLTLQEIIGNTINTFQGALENLERPFHYIRVLHTLVNYLVAELTKLNLQHQTLKGQVEALAYDLDQLRKRERSLEKMVVLKEEKP